MPFPKLYNYKRRYVWKQTTYDDVFLNTNVDQTELYILFEHVHRGLFMFCNIN